MSTDSFVPFTNCPICGTELENVFFDPETRSLVMKFDDDNIEEIFLTDEGVFRFIEDDEHPELLHIDWHHKH